MEVPLPGALGELYLAVVVLYRVLYYGKAKPGTA